MCAEYLLFMFLALAALHILHRSRALKYVRQLFTAAIIPLLNVFLDARTIERPTCTPQNLLEENLFVTPVEFKIDPETIWQMPGEEVVKLIRSGYFANSSGKIRFYAPSFMYYKTRYFRSSSAAFPSISITGRFCALKCKHCDGKVLNTMMPAVTPERLVNLCTQLKQKGGIGCLISGGCLPDGSVPLGNFIDAIAKVKRDLGLTVVVHTGIVELSMANSLKEAEVDAVLIDIIGSDETIKEIYQLNVEVQDFDRSLKALHEAGIPFVPHVLVGLHYGKLKGEFKALQMISKYEPSAVIVIALMLIHGTPMENVSPPTSADIAKVLAMARLMMPNTPLVLGCMRPKGKSKGEIDVLAVNAGVNAIAFPADEAIKQAESLGLEISFSSLCCSQIYEDIQRNLGNVSRLRSLS